MASIKKYPARSVGRLMLHNNRSPNDNVEHSNEEIDSRKTMFNYHLKRGSVDTLNERLGEVFQARPEERTIVMAEAVVTLPKDVKQKDEKAFFKAVYSFYANDFGEQNIINAVVHKDETKPHIHLDFVPTVIDKEVRCVRGTMRERNQKWLDEHGGTCERLSAKDAINRDYLEQMHGRLSQHVTNELGYEVEILNGATANGNKKVLQLKVDTLKKQIATYEARLEHYEKEAESLHQTAQRWGISENDIGLKPLLDKIDDLETRNAILQEIISREGYRYTRGDLERLREKRFVPSQAVSVSVYDGTLCNAEFEQNAAVVIEMPTDLSKPSPQKVLIEKDADVDRLYKMATISSSKVSIKKSKVTDKVYIFVKTDTEKQTLDCLLELERQLRENEEEMKGRRIYFDKMETDKFDFARSVLNTLDNPCNYYARRDLKEKQGNEKAKEQSLS